MSIFLTNPDIGSKFFISKYNEYKDIIKNNPYSFTKELKQKLNNVCFRSCAR